MSGWWLVSYVALWVLVMAACVLLVGMVRHTALAHSADEAAIARKRARPQDTPAIEDDGPTIGSTLPQVVASSINGHGDVDLADAQGRQTLLMFLSSVCESCQHIIEPLNGALAARPDTLRIIAIMKADENGCRAFDALFPLNGPMLCDERRELSLDVMGVFRTPFGLLYDSDATLIRKGTVMGPAYLEALLGDAEQPAWIAAEVYPHPRITTPEAAHP